MVVGSVVVVGGKSDLNATSGSRAHPCFPITCHGIVHQGLLLGVRGGTLGGADVFVYFMRFVAELDG